MKVPYKNIGLGHRKLLLERKSLMGGTSNHWLEPTKTPRKSLAVNIFVTSSVVMKLPFRTQALKAMKDLV